MCIYIYNILSIFDDSLKAGGLLFFPNWLGPR